VKRAPARSGRVPVASGTGAEAPAAAGDVGAAPVLLGRRWSCRSTWAEDRARAGRRDGARGLRERIGRQCRATVAAWARRRRLRMRAMGETERNEPTRARRIG
jgi:hypothetical protein